MYHTIATYFVQLQLVLLFIIALYDNLAKKKGKKRREKGKEE